MIVLTYTNENGASVNFTNTTMLNVDAILLTDADGIHGLPAEVHVISQSGQDGASYVGSVLPPREVSLTCRIMHDIIDERIRMLEALDPKVPGELTLRRGNFRRRLKCHISQAPSFAKKNGMVFTVHFTAPNPYWLGATESSWDMAYWEPLFEWPLDIPVEGIDFGERTNFVGNVINHGQATIGFRALITAQRAVRNPVISHVVSYKRIKFNVSMTKGDVLTIATGFGEKEATLRRNGAAEAVNAMDLLVIDEDFEWLQLVPGDNPLRYGAEEGESNMSIKMFYDPGYLGV